MESIVGGHLRQMKDNLYSYIYHGAVIHLGSFVIKLLLMFCI